jgi:hypothetical protein
MREVIHLRTLSMPGVMLSRLGRVRIPKASRRRPKISSWLEFRLVLYRLRLVLLRPIVLPRT